MKKETASKVPQLGTHTKQSIPDLKVLSTYDQQVSEFNKETGLTEAQIRGEDAIPIHEGTYRTTRPLTTYKQQLLDFSKSSGLTPAQLIGEEEIALHTGANRPEYVPGRELVWPRLLQFLPTRMYELDKWNMYQGAGGMDSFYVHIEDHHYFCGHQVYTIPMKEFWFLFNMDALDVSFVSCWAL
jgi:hypothetical protein